MKIGIVCYPTYGGSGVMATELGMELAELGHEVHFITYSQPVRLKFKDRVFYHEVQISNYPLFEYSPYELVLTSTMVDVIKREKLDVLHVHYAIPHASAAIMARAILKSEGIHVPIVTTLHGTDITLVGKDDSFKPVIEYAINESDAVTAVSNSLVSDTKEHFNIKREIQTIPNFVCLKKYQGIQDQALRKCYAPEGQRIIVHISNFRKVKRVQDVVSTFDLIQREVPSKLLLVGDGPERHSVERQITELGLQDAVKMLGKIRDTEQVLGIADLFLLPSEFESFGLAALEAMAAQVPVISTNQGGLPEVNKEGFSGYLCDVGDISCMANKALTIIKDDRVLAHFRLQAFEQANQFQVHKILPKYVELYERLINN